MENQNEIGKAKESGWQHHYNSLSNIKDECAKFGTLSRQGGSNSVEYLKAYLNHVYTFGQNVFCFYPQSLEDELTNEWQGLLKEVNNFIEDIEQGFSKSNKIPEELTMKIAKYFNKLIRLAKEAGLLIDQEDAGSKEPVKGSLGLR